MTQRPTSKPPRRLIFKSLVELPTPYNPFPPSHRIPLPSTLFYYFELERVGEEREWVEYAKRKRAEASNVALRVKRKLVKAESVTSLVSHETPPDLPEETVPMTPRSVTVMPPVHTFAAPERLTSQEIQNEILALRERIQMMAMENEQHEVAPVAAPTLKAPILSQPKKSSHRKVEKRKASSQKHIDSPDTSRRRSKRLPPPPKYILRISSKSRQSSSDKHAITSPSFHNLHFTMRCRFDSLQIPSELRDCILYHSEDDSLDPRDEQCYISSKSFARFIRNVLYSNEYTSQWIRMDSTTLNVAPHGIFLSLYPSSADAHCTLHFKNTESIPSHRATFNTAVEQSLQPEQVETLLHQEWYGESESHNDDHDDDSVLARQQQKADAIINAASERFAALKSKQLELRKELNNFELSGKFT